MIGVSIHAPAAGRDVIDHRKEVDLDRHPEYDGSHAGRRKFLSTGFSTEALPLIEKFWGDKVPFVHLLQHRFARNPPIHATVLAIANDNIRTAACYS